ncbi:hypothetical protein ACF0H5_022564 [Mactra antiquata]
MTYITRNMTNCHNDDNPVPQLFGITLNDCVLECGLRKHCVALIYHHQTSSCLLFRTRTGLLNTKTEKCEYILKSDITIHKTPCNEECHKEKTCDIVTRTCKTKECIFPNPVNAKVLGNRVSVGSKLRYKCNKGTNEVNNIFTGTCLENGTWSYVATCKLQVKPNDTETDSTPVLSKPTEKPNHTETDTTPVLSKPTEKPNHAETDSTPVHSSVTNDSYCDASYVQGNRETGVYTYIIPSGKQLTLRCDMSSDTGGWIVIQRRVNASDFFKTWEEYKTGFGDLNGNFWLGNENIWTLTKTGTWNIRFDLRHENESVFAVYSSFSIGNETTNYTLHVGKYIDGNVTDSFSSHNGSTFATKDRDDKCTLNSQGAWWYISFHRCHMSNLNGLYGSTSFGRGIIWYSWKGFQTSLTGTLMKIQRVD